MQTGELRCVPLSRAGKRASGAFKEVVWWVSDKSEDPQFASKLSVIEDTSLLFATHWS